MDAADAKRFFKPDRWMILLLKMFSLVYLFYSKIVTYSILLQKIKIMSEEQQRKERVSVNLEIFGSSKAAIYNKTKPELLEITNSSLSACNLKFVFQAALV